MRFSLLPFIFILCFRPLFPVLDYVVNYEYISKVLCINKEKPELKCNGKCHLMKEMAKTTESEKPFSTDKKDCFMVSEFIIFYNGFDFNFDRITPFRFYNSFIYSNFYSFLEGARCFKPPVL